MGEILTGGVQLKRGGGKFKIIEFENNFLKQRSEVYVAETMRYVLCKSGGIRILTILTCCGEFKVIFKETVYLV